MAATVTVPNHWELNADPDTIELHGFYWERAAGGLRPLLMPAASPEAGEAGELARRMAGYLHDTAVLLRSAQEQLDHIWTRLLRRVLAVKEDQRVSIVLRSPADEVIVAKAVKAAKDIRRHANERLEWLAESVDRDILPRMNRLLEA
jgi:hypothetical protein